MLGIISDSDWIIVFCRVSRDPDIVCISYHLSRRYWGYSMNSITYSSALWWNFTDRSGYLMPTSGLIDFDMASVCQSIWLYWLIISANGTSMTNSACSHPVGYGDHGFGDGTSTHRISLSWYLIGSSRRYVEIIRPQMSVSLSSFHRAEKSLHISAYSRSVATR